MLPSVRALLSGIIDYAGMFPPAQLPLEQAIRNYARYRTEPESWMLGRFVCPAARLAELSPFVDELFRDGPPLAVSVLWTGGETLRDYLVGITRDLETFFNFQLRFKAMAVIESFELRVALDLLNPAESKNLRQVLFGCDLALVKSVGNPQLDTWYELPPGSGLSQRLDIFLTALTVEAPAHKGFKLRCGGAVPDATPTPNDIASAITSCRDALVPMKFTAGLHHPIQHRDDRLNTHVHGFLNVFCAGVLAHAHALSVEQLRPILAEENSAAFQFDSSGLSWNDFRATLPQIESARRQLVTSFGSCSFDEPRDDLRAMGLLP
jgi:hypothetical protein